MSMSAVLTLEPKDWITVAALILGPVLAIQIQIFLEKLRVKRQRREALFRNLMGTRSERLNRIHVNALNMIDIEFYGRTFFGTRWATLSEKTVTNAWKNYNDHLNANSQYTDKELWSKRMDDLFITLLYEMAKALGYTYDEVSIRRDCYRPELHANIENAQLRVLAGLEQVLTGQAAFPVSVKTPGQVAATAIAAPPSNVLPATPIRDPGR
jgi:hypothetical protein